MNSREGLKYIKDNSRLIIRMAVKGYDDGECNIIFEHRLTYSGKLFVLQDAGKNGWDIYFLSGAGNNVDRTIEKFDEYSGIIKTQK